VSSWRRSPLRLALAFLVAVVALLEIQALAETAASQGRLRSKAAARVSAAYERHRQRAARELGARGAAAAAGLLRRALAQRVAEVELFEPSGRALAAAPAAAPVEHWPGPGERLRIAGGEFVSFGPVAGDSARLLTYRALDSGEGVVFVRLATPVPELVEELRRLRRLLTGHALALLVLILAAGLALLPGRGAAGARSAPSYEAFEEAISRLRRHGDAVTRRHQAERERLESTLQDREAMARAGELTAGIVHEVRNGLATILGYARLIERDPSDPTELAGQIREECESLERVVVRFLELVQSNRLTPGSVVPRRLLERVVAQERRHRPGVQVHWSGGVSGELAADEELLERALENLARNALEAAGPTGNVWISMASDEQAVSVAMADDGPGLPERLLEGGVQAFYTTKSGGLGLGLALALKIVQLHGGELTLRNRERGGAVISMRLPRRLPDP